MKLFDHEVWILAHYVYMARAGSPGRWDGSKFSLAFAYRLITQGLLAPLKDDAHRLVPTDKGKAALAAARLRGEI